MRWLVLLLVLANLLFFAFSQGWLSLWIRGDREPQRLSDQRSPERLRVAPLELLGRPLEGSAALPARRPDATGTEDGAGSGRASRIEGAVLDAPAVARPPESLPVAACVAFGPLDEQRANRVREALESAGALVESVRAEQAASYLVYVAPLGTPAEAQRRMAELRRIGQNDAFVIQDGPLRRGLSVGLFRSEETARALVTRLEALGETGLQIAPRGAVTARVRLKARWAEASGAAAAPTISSRFDAPARDCD